jgi:hypothetical protein
LNGQPSTFAFDYYEPSTSANTLTLGYSAGNADINTAEAFVRIALTGGSISMSSATGTVLTATGTTTYPRDRRLTFSLMLNHSPGVQSFNGGTVAAKTLEVWYYDWGTTQIVHVLTIDVASSPRTPLRVGFRTFSAETGVQAYFDNVKLLDGLVVVTPGFVPTIPPSLPPKPFVHPSVHNTSQELERIKYRVKYEPTSAARMGWDDMTNSSLASLSYQHVPYSNVVVKGSGTTPSETQFRNDGQAAYAMALQWVVTGNNQYRDKALAILSDWSATFVLLSPDVGTSTSQLQLESAWYAPVLVAAADIMRYYNNGVAGWNTNDIARFDAMLNYLYSLAFQASDNENNWGASGALALMAVGVYQENRTRFNTGVQTWRDRMVGINGLVDSYNDDSIYEVCRDTIHPQYTLQVWMQGAEIAWKHNIDLYGMTLNGSGSPQLARNIEYFGQLFMGLRPTPCDSNFNATYNYLGEQSHSGAYDIAHNHYINRYNSNTIPVYADMVVNQWRPGGFDGHFVGWSTLTHGDLSAGIPAISALILTNSILGTNRGLLAEGDTINLRDYTNAGWTLTAQTTGTVSWVQFQTNSTPSHSDSNLPFPSNLPPPGNYWFGALPWKTMPSGAIPGDTFLRFVRVIELSSNWDLHEIGGPVMPTWAQEAGSNLTVAAAGAGVTGNSDQFGLVSAEISGDLQITARLNNTIPATNSSRMGIMVREGVAAGARNVFLSLAPLATNGLAFSARTQYPGITTNIVSGAAGGSTWVRLVRLANVFSGYYSTNGNSWTAFGSITNTMNPLVRAGLAVGSGIPDKVARADFQNVLIEPLSASYTEWQNWLFARRNVTNPAFTASTADPDQDGRSNQVEYWLGSDPLAANPTPAVKALGVTGNVIQLRFTERKNAVALGRSFLYSSNLGSWNSVTPLSNIVVEDFGSVVTRDVAFPVSSKSGFYRSSY